MKEKSRLRYILSLLCFLLCSAVIYNPLYKTSRPVLCCISSVVIGLALSALYTHLFKNVNISSQAGFAKKALCTSGFICLSLASVFYISSLLECFSLFSPFYSSSEKGLVFALLLLFICSYASHRKNDGIFRLCQLLCPVFILYYIILFFAPVSTDVLVLPDRQTFLGFSPESFMQSLYSGLYLFADIAVFRFVFDRQNSSHISKHLLGKQSTISVFSFGLIMCINRIRASFCFGETLVRGFSHCDLAAIKLLPVFSLYELYLLFISFACIIKVSVYIRAASKLLCIIIGKNTEKGFMYDSYICALFCLILSCSMTRILDSTRLENTVFIPFLLLSSFFILLICALPSKRQNKS